MNWLQIEVFLYLTLPWLLRQYAQSLPVLAHFFYPKNLNFKTLPDKISRNLSNWKQEEYCCAGKGKPVLFVELETGKLKYRKDMILLIAEYFKYLGLLGKNICWLLSICKIMIDEMDSLSWLPIITTRGFPELQGNKNVIITDRCKVFHLMVLQLDMYDNENQHYMSTTVCPKSLDPFHIVSVIIWNGSGLLTNS